MPDIKTLIREEWIKCAKDPVYFFKKYCYIQHPHRGKILFNLYPFQEDLMSNVNDNRFNVILKSRQLGISTLSAGYSLWLMLFHEDKNILVIATKQEVAKNLVTKVRFMHDNLPSWLKGQTEEDNKLSLPRDEDANVSLFAKWITESVYEMIEKKYLKKLNLSISKANADGTQVSGGGLQERYTLNYDYTEDGRVQFCGKTNNKIMIQNNHL